MDDRQPWDHFFLELAKFYSMRSRDPSTKVGAVIVRRDNTVASLGYNGFSRHMSDDVSLYCDRTKKYARVIHAEMNAILTAREPLEGYTLYTWPFMPCERCAVHVIQSGIIRVVAPEPSDFDKAERWSDNFKSAMAFFNEAGVEVNLYKDTFDGWRRS